MTPPRTLEFLVKLLVPRAYREQVLGDLHQRYQSPLGYVMDAATAVPAAIVCQIRRVTPLPFLVLEVLIVYGAFYAAALLMPSIAGPPDGAKVARLTAIILAGLLIHDAYGARPGLPRWKAVGRILLPIYFSCGIVWIWQVFQPGLQLFPGIVTTQIGLWLSWALLALVRWWIDTDRDNRLRGAR